MVESRHRYRNGGLALVALRGQAYMAALGRRGFQAALSLYGDSDAARSLRASDIRRKRHMSAAAWRTLMRERAATFGLPVTKLLPDVEEKEVVMSRTD